MPSVAAQAGADEECSGTRRWMRSCSRLLLLPGRPGIRVPFSCRPRSADRDSWNRGRSCSHCRLLLGFPRDISTHGIFLWLPRSTVRPWPDRIRRANVVRL